MFHMTQLVQFDSAKTKVEKSVDNDIFRDVLSSALDQFAVLGQLRCHRHVHEFVCNAHLKENEITNEQLGKDINIGQV